MSLIYQVASNAKILSDQWKTCCFEVLNCLNFIAVYPARVCWGSLAPVRFNVSRRQGVVYRTYVLLEHTDLTNYCPQTLACQTLACQTLACPCLETPTFVDRYDTRKFSIGKGWRSSFKRTNLARTQAPSRLQHQKT